MDVLGGLALVVACFGVWVAVRHDHDLQQVQKELTGVARKLKTVLGDERQAVEDARAAASMHRERRIAENKDHCAWLVERMESTRKELTTVHSALPRAGFEASERLLRDWDDLAHRWLECVSAFRSRRGEVADLKGQVVFVVSDLSGFLQSSELGGWRNDDAAILHQKTSEIIRKIHTADARAAELNAILGEPFVTLNEPFIDLTESVGGRTVKKTGGIPSGR